MQKGKTPVPFRYGGTCFLSFGSYPEQCNGAGAAVGADNRADVTLIDFFDAERFELVNYIGAVCGTVAMADKDGFVFVRNRCLVMFEKGVQARTAAAHLLHRDEVAFVIDMQHRLDAKQRAGYGRRARKPPAALEEHQVVDGEPGADLRRKVFCIGGRGVKVKVFPL